MKKTSFDHKSLLQAIIFILVCISKNAQNVEAFKHYLQNRHEKGKFNAVVMIMKNDSIYYQDAFGVADKDSSNRLNT